MATVNMDGLKPNSFTYRAEEKKTEERKRPTPVVKKENVIREKEGLVKKIWKTFVKDDIEDIRNYVVHDILIPGIQAGVLNMISMMFFREPYDGRNTSKQTGGRVSYSSISRGSGPRGNERRSYKREPRSDYRNIRLKYREDAEEVIHQMVSRIRDYGFVSVAELLDMVELPSEPVDFNWGWDDERDIGIRGVYNGWLIDVEKPKWMR